MFINTDYEAIDDDPDANTKITGLDPDKYGDFIDALLNTHNDPNFIFIPDASEITSQLKLGKFPDFKVESKEDGKENNKPIGSFKQDSCTLTYPFNPNLLKAVAAVYKDPVVEECGSLMAALKLIESLKDCKLTFSHDAIGQIKQNFSELPEAKKVALDDKYNDFIRKFDNKLKI